MAYPMPPGGIPWLGITHGTYTGTSINSTIMTYCLLMGCRYFRVQASMSTIWLNVNDPPSAWSWGTLDAAVNLILTSGMEPILTVDNSPLFDIGSLSTQITSEPYYYPNPLYQVQYALAAASRYNGIYSIPTYGPMLVRYMEMGNETYNIHFTNPAPLAEPTLNQNLIAGNSYDSLVINTASVFAPTYSAVVLNPGVISPDICQLNAPIAITSNNLTLYLSLIPSTTIPTANLLYASQGSPATNTSNSKVDAALGWGEILSQSTLNPWAAAGSEPTPSDNGWVVDSTILEGSNMLAGDYSLNLAFVINGLGANTLTADIHGVFSKRSTTPTYIVIADVDIGSVAFVAGVQQTVFTSLNVPTSTAFAIGDKLIFNLFANITSNTSVNPAHISITELSLDVIGMTGVTDALLGTPGYGSGTATSLSVQTNVEGTSIHTGSFIPRYNHTTGEPIKIYNKGIYASPFFIYNGLDGVKLTTGPNPARDPRFMQDNIRQIYRAVKLIRPDMLLGSPALWWTQGKNQGAFKSGNPGNHFAFTSGFELYSADIYKYIDYMNFHYYSKLDSPITGGKLTASFYKALYNIDAGLAAAGLQYMPIHVTEIGWGVPNDTDDATRAMWYSYVLNVFKTYAQTTGKDCKFLLYNIDANGANTVADSLITWAGGSSYNTTASFLAVQNFLLLNPSLL